MTKLAPLRNKLVALRNRRSRARKLTAWSATLLAAIWTIMAIFAIDWMFSMTAVQRVIVIVVGCGIVAWVFRRKTWPWLGDRETEVDIALMVERHQKIDSDLVAAIQFESPEASDWGSPQLEGAVVDYVAEFSKGWNVYDGFTREKLVKRLAAVGGTLAIVALLAVNFSGHFETFLNRMMLGNKHYPTKTIIEVVKINSEPLDVDPDGEEIGGQFAYGRPLEFKVLCDGDLPDSGTVRLRATNGMSTEIEMTRAEVDPDSPVPAGKAYYEGELPRLVDTLECSLFFGDAFTDPRTLQVIPLPVVEATLVGTRPDYARGGKGGAVIRSTAKQLKILEGSKVDFEVVCKNKGLRSVALVIERPTDFESDIPFERNEDGHAILPLTKVEDDVVKVGKEERQVWRLSGDGTPLDGIRGGGVAYHLAIEDEHGMTPERPIAGAIVALPDMAPNASARVLSNYWLPSAKPKIAFRVSDDFGVNAASIEVTVSRESTGEEEKQQIPLRIDEPPIPAAVLPAERAYELDLSQFSLTKGDEVAIELKVTDYRGQDTGSIGTSNSLKLFIVDQTQILAGVTNIDKSLLEKMDLMKKAVRTDRPRRK